MNIKNLFVEIIVPITSLCLLLIILFCIIINKISAHINKENKKVKKIEEKRYPNIDTSIIYKEINLEKIKDADSIKRTLYNMYKEIVKIYTSGNCDKLKNLVSNNLYNNYVELNEMLRKNGEVEVIKNINLNDIRILNIKKSKNSCTIKFYLNINCYNYKIDKKSKITMRGFDDRKINQELLIYLVKTDDKCVIDKIVKVGQKTLERDKKNEKKK